MEQKSKADLVQQKIKQMIQSRRRITSKETQAPLKRLKSNLQTDQPNHSQAQNIQNKPKSSMIRVRPRTTQRNKNEQTNSLTTDSSNKNDIDVKTLVDDAFERGFELAKYLNKKNLNPQKSKQKLLENNLFYTLVISKLSKVQEEFYQHITQKEIIVKLQKIALIQKQERSCLMIQDKISSLIDQRLKCLSQC